MKNPHFKYELLNNRIFTIKSLLLVLWAAVAFSCSESNYLKSDYDLLTKDNFVRKTISLDFADWQGQYVRYKFSINERELLAWTSPEKKLKILSYPNGELLHELDLYDLASFSVSDVVRMGDSLYLAGLNSEMAIFDLLNGDILILNIKAALCLDDYRVYTYKKSPLYVEDGFLYFSNSDPRYNEYFSDFSIQKLFFSAPLEMRYDLKSNSTKCFGSYPAAYRENEMDFYSWPVRRQRLNSRSIYSFSHIDTLYAYNDRTDQKQTVERKSTLRSCD